MPRLDKWLKLFDNVVSYEAVHISEVVDDGPSTSWPILIQHYANHWFQIEVHLRVYTGGQAKCRDYRLTLRTASDISANARNLDLASISPRNGVLKTQVEGIGSQNRGSMFVIVPEAIENPQGAITVIVPRLC